MSLFREEVLAHKTENLHGTINLAVPMSWQLIGFSLSGILAVAVLFVMSARYSRTEIASGSILPAGGLLQVVPARTGRVEDVAVEEGQLVRKGERLAWIGVDEADRAGKGKQTAVLSAIDKQQQRLQGQQALARAAAAAQQHGYATQVSGLRQELRSLDAQVAVEQKLVDMAQTDLAQATQIAKRGFISQRDLAVRQETLLSRQQQLASLEQTRTAKASSIEQAEVARNEAAANASSATAALAASQAQVERDRAITRGDEGYALIAPTDGRVAALNVHIGDSVNGQDSIMAIIPSGGHLIARFYIPGKAAGFVRAGQSVRLALDAYPYERFGTVEGVITVLSNAPLMRADKNGIATPMYIATAMVKSPFIKAYGRRQALLPGMTFTARIVVESRSLVQWLFDPLFAATRDG